MCDVMCYVFSIMRCGGLVVNRIPIGYQCKYRALTAQLQHSSADSALERGNFIKIFLIFVSVLAALARDD